MRTGVVDRFRSLPMARSAVLAGRALADMLANLIALAVLVVAGLIDGWGIHDGVASWPTRSCPRRTCRPGCARWPSRTRSARSSPRCATCSTGMPADAAWPLQHAIPVSIAWCVAILAVSVPLAVRRYRLATAR
jgi:hypothetical protein